MGGYEVANKAAISVAFICRLCCLLVRDPVKLLCGHIYCETCVDHVEDKKTVTCSICKEATLRRDIIIDEELRDSLLKLIVVCSCKWSGPLSDYQVHINQSHGHTTYSNHLLSVDAPRRHREGEYSEARSMRSSYAVTTAASANDGIVSCLYAMKSATARLASGIGSPNTRIDAPAATQRIDRHPNNASHISLLTLQFQQTEMEMNDLHRLICETSEDNEDGCIKQSVQEANSPVSTGIHIDPRRVVQSCSCCQNNYCLCPHHAQAKEMIKLIDDNERLEKRISVLEMEKDCVTFINNLPHIQSIETTTTLDGLFIWRIEGVSHKIRELVSGIIPYIESAKFVASTCGQRLYVRLYVNDNETDNHIALHIYLDTSVHYALNARIIFCMIDQSDDHPLCHAIQPLAVQMTNVNAQAGFPYFMPTSAILQEQSRFVRDGTIRIITSVSPTDSPRFANFVPNVKHALHAVQ